MAATCTNMQNVSAPCEGTVTPASGTFENSSTISVVFGSGDAVSVANGVAISTFTNTSTGTINGVYAGSPSRTAIDVAGSIATLDNAGQILADADGIYVASTGSITSINNAAGATIRTDGTNAISVDGGQIGTITNAGTIKSAYTAGISVASGGSIGAIVNNGGTISADRTYGIYSHFSTIGSITNSGTIYGARTGIHNENSDLGSLTNSGIIEGGQTGLYHTGGTINTITNSGTIRGNGNTGVSLNDAVGTLTNTGTIEGVWTGLYAAGVTGKIENLGGTITSTGYGMTINNTLTELNNTGEISGSSYGFYNNGTIGTITNAGTISSGSYAVYNYKTIDTLNNSGTIEGAYTTITNNGGTINALINSGLIKSAEYGAVYNDDDSTVGSITNTATGTIDGASAGIYNRDIVNTITNAGVINSADGYGMYNSGAIQSITNTGTINGEVSNGIYNAGGTIGTITNGGTISGGTAAIYNIAAIDTLTNTGRILGTLTYGIYNSGGTINKLANSGTIQSAEYGIYTASGLGALENSGTIHGGATGIYAEDVVLDQLVNTGTISGGIYGYNQVGGSIGTLINRGAILGAFNNTGSLGSVTNAQGGANVAPLTISGSMMTGDYLAHITSSTQYGQLAFTDGNGVLKSFGLTLDSTLANGTYQDVLQGIAQVGGTTSGTVGRYRWTLLADAATAGTWDLAVKRLGPDIANTLLELAHTRDETLTVMRNRAAMVTNALSTECADFGKSGVCLSGDIRSTSLKNESEVSVTFAAAARLTSNVRAGAFVELPMNHSGTMHAVEREEKAIVGGFVGYAQKADGTGLTARVSAASQSGAAKITRGADLAETEAGVGHSRIKAWAVGGELGYGFKIGGHTHLTPYLGLQYVRTERKGYAEAAATAVEFPLTYATYGQRTTTGRTGLTLSGAAGKVHYRVGGGVEFDLRSRASAFRGVSAIEGFETFSLANTAGAKKFRGSGSAELGYQALPGVVLSIGGSVRGEAFTGKTMASATAGVRFGF